MYFSDKIVWITGASSGIGRALAIQLSKEAATLVLSCRNLAALEEVQQLCKHPNKIHLVTLDLADYTNLSNAVSAVLEKLGTVDILINNGGISQRALAKDTHIRVDERIMHINYLGTISLTKALLPHFIEKQKGHFVVTTSVVGLIGTPYRSSYAASKHALHGFFDSLRAECYNDNISVSLICPGFVQTAISLNALTGDGSPQQTMDVATENGLDPSYFAKQMIKAIAQKKEEAYIAGTKEKLGIYVKRWFPKLFSVLIRKMKVT